MKFISFIILVTVFITSCSEQNTSEPIRQTRASNAGNVVKINAVIGATFLSIGQTFKVWHNKRQVIRTEKGSRIHVPENAFVLKEDGTPVEGSVDLQFKEYETRGEIIASDIPMYFIDEDSTKHIFESAGMFEISATQDGRELALAKGKEIKVELATDVDGPFDFWKLKEDSSNWLLKDTDCKAIRNPYIEEQKDSIDLLNSQIQPKPKQPVKYKEVDQLFDIKVMGYHNTVLNEMNGIMWKYSGTDPKKNPATINAFSTEYNLVYLEPTEADFLEYTLTFETKDKRELVLEAVPVYQGKLLDRKNKKMAEILRKNAEATVQMKRLNDQLKREKELLRVFSVGEFGVYNYDCYYSDPGVTRFVADFSLEGGGNIELMNFYLLPSDRRIVVRYYPASFDKFYINPNIRNRIIAIDSENEVYYLSNGDLRKMKLKQYSEGQTVKFRLKKFGKIEDTTKLEDFIKSV